MRKISRAKYAHDLHELREGSRQRSKAAYEGPARWNVRLGFTNEKNNRSSRHSSKRSNLTSRSSPSNLSNLSNLSTRQDRPGEAPHATGTAGRHQP